MTELDKHWARSRIEAMADRSLSRRDERRMRAALARDPQLRRAVERAREVRAVLRRLGKGPVPVSLYARLASIPRPASRPKRTVPLWSWTSAAAAASTIAAVLVLVTRPDPVDPRTAALRDFELAMAYLHRSYEITGEHVKRAMERELKEALGMSGESGGSESRGGNGG